MGRWRSLHETRVPTRWSSHGWKGQPGRGQPQARQHQAPPHPGSLLVGIPFALEGNVHRLHQIAPVSSGTLGNRQWLLSGN